ncbi:alpha/beta fold hydrolase [Spirillospora sp. NPDC048819]|uniref:alpha/beta fold hydrolase n=1 Tax=Spirillospora sp. NPDC048819 TaxID=3155268 RepID=UPI0033E1A5BF
MSAARTVDAAVRMCADVAGERGSPVLLLHGIGSAAASFAAQLPVLARRHRVAAWDAPGYARSSDPVPPYGMDDFAEAAAALLTALDMVPAHVVGVSWGGVIATRLALRRPDAVRSLVLAGSTRGSGRTPEGAAAMRARAGELARLGPGRFARLRAPRLLSDGAPAAAAETVRDVMAGAIRLPGYAEAATAMAETDHTADLPGLRVPTLVLVGEHDRVTGVEESERMHRLIPGSRFAVLPGAGHLCNQERPELFTSLVGGFLAELDGRRPDGPGAADEPGGGAGTVEKEKS